MFRSFATTVLLFCFSGLVQGQSSAILTDWETLKMDAQRMMQPDAFRTMQVGEQEVMIVTNETNLPLGKGVIVLVSESGRNGASAISLAPMTEYLNDYGWATILLTAPTLNWQIDESSISSTDDLTPAPSDETQQSQPDSSNMDDVPSYLSTPSINRKMFEAQEQQFMLLMSAANQEALNYPGFIVVVAQGTSAAFLSKLYAEGMLRAPDAMVAISANFPEKELNDEVGNFLARTPMPVMDIFNQWDNKWTTSNAKTRKIAVEKALKLHFRQREIIGTALKGQQFHYIAKEVHGWLTYMGW